MQQIPSTFPVVATDIVLAVFKYYGDMSLNLEMEFEHRLDPDRLERASALLLDAEPILGCRLVEKPIRPIWVRTAVKREEFFTYAEGTEAANVFRSESLDPLCSPQVRTGLFREPERDRLIVKVNHAVSDAGGCKHVSRRLSSIYRCLQDEPTHVPEPNVHGARDAWQVLRLLPWYAFPKIYWNYIKATLSNLIPFKTHALRLQGVRSGPPEFIIRHFPPESVAALSEYGHRVGSTINDLLTAAFIASRLALKSHTTIGAVRVGTTMDLRRHYLPDGCAGGICNLSAMEFINLGTGPQGEFTRILSRVTAHTKMRKKNYLGLADYMGVLPTLHLIPFGLTRPFFNRVLRFAEQHGSFPNVITNMGPIDPPDVNYDAPPARAWILTPPIYPPVFGAGFTGYNGSLTLSAGIFGCGEEQQPVRDLFDGIAQITSGV